MPCIRLKRELQGCRGERAGTGQSGSGALANCDQRTFFQLHPSSTFSSYTVIGILPPTRLDIDAVPCPSQQRGRTSAGPAKMGPPLLHARADDDQSARASFL